MNDRIARTIRKGIIFDDAVLDAARPFIQENTTVIDAGANFGQLSREFARGLNGTGQLIACEADSYVAEILRRNVALSGMANIEVAEGALWDVDGQELVFPEPDFDKYLCFGSFGLDPTATEGKVVKTRRIDSLPIRHRVSFIKVDVQGADLHAMKGARETIMRDRPVIIFEYEEQFQAQFGTNHQQYLDFIASVGYRVLSQLRGLDYVIVPQT